MIAQKFLTLGIALFLSCILMSNKLSGQGKLPTVDSQVTFLYYKDVEKAEDFYGNILGFKKTYDEGWVRIFQISATSYVGVVDETKGSHKTSSDKPVMLSIVTNEVDKWYDVLKAKNLNFRSEISDSQSVPVRGFLIEDPEGYSVEFFQWMNK